MMGITSTVDRVFDGDISRHLATVTGPKAGNYMEAVLLAAYEVNAQYTYTVALPNICA
jgi:hypothetical protein